MVIETFKFSKDVDLGQQRRNKQGQRFNPIQGEMALIIALFRKKKSLKTCFGCFSPLSGKKNRYKFRYQRKTVTIMGGASFEEILSDI